MQEIPSHRPSSPIFNLLLRRTALGVLRVRLRQAVLLEQGIDLGSGPQVVVDLAGLGAADGSELDWCHVSKWGPITRDGDDPKRTLLAAQLGRVHGLAEHLDGQAAGLLQVALLLVVLLEQALGAGVVGADAGGLPAAVVAGRVALVQLELALRVVAGVDEGHAEGTQTTVLRVALLQIA